MNRLLTAAGIAAFVGLIASSTAFLHLRSSYQRAAIDACQLVADNYYRRDEEVVKDFVERCFRDANDQTFYFSKNLNVKRINNRLSALRSSHLQLYSPAENQAIWDNQGLDTGLRSRIVDADLVVYAVLPNSPASRAGVRAGDALVSLNGDSISTSFEAQVGSGRFEIGRGENIIEVNLVPEELREDLSWSLQPLSNGSGYLKIPSFLANYFDTDEWRTLARNLLSYKHLIVDLRGNNGGSFPAMLRALSPFRCQAPFIGQIYRPFERDLKASADLRDDLDTNSQLEQLDSAAIINLKTFTSYGCFNGEVTVLIDSDTASVAEIFAQSFYSRPRSRVWGQPSSGQVVMARWFPIAALGSHGFQLAIPIAGYRTADGANLENQGIYPQRTLHYEIAAALKGRDNWIEESLRPFGSGTRSVRQPTTSARTE